MENEKRITLKTSASFHKRVKVKATREGLDLSNVGRALFAAWANGQIKIDASGAVVIESAQAPEQSKAA